ncbi:F-box protein MET30 [Nakaseomyces glabratus]|uniref:F-box protein MET30 n=1 Tax=Candida glabrata TaxID=5478 RepID=A0A0W0E669_CANGB|nr:F-box protein MET30 [Nakaseomyces glabratus]KTB08497.1 F-box protein MET30 [Nakaseomyces glabratus]KTB09794.1 F-box protein MET30 [Nakaseomyces glabratus]KTB19517.1 F-box protein MET30 [Nakaseomyces glabratus]
MEVRQVKHSRDDTEAEGAKRRKMPYDEQIQMLAEEEEEDTMKRDMGDALATSTESQSGVSVLPRDNFQRYCYRHNPEIQTSNTHELCYKQDMQRIKMINNKISQLACPKEQADIHHIISKYTNSNDKVRKLILDGILTSSCFPQLSYIAQHINTMIKIDFISVLPQELSLKILGYLDCQSLCNASMVCKNWHLLADDDRVWYHMCEQHIDRKCPNCGWGLPLLHMKRARVCYIKAKNPNTTVNDRKMIQDNDNRISPLTDRTQGNESPGATSSTNVCTTASNNTVSGSKSSGQGQQENGRCRQKSWKMVYRERFKVESNWRKGLCTIQEFKGHMDGVLTLQFNYRLLFTGSYDTTVAIWDLFTGKLIRRLTGHSDGVKTLYFDDQKLITGSLDKTIRVWNYITGECISTYRGHTDSVMSVDSHKKIIVSGSADKTVKVWHVESRTCYTLKGHTEWVNCVKLHPKSFSCYSCSDDTTIRMWDIRTNTCLRVFRGHVGQVQKVIPLTIIDAQNLVTDERKPGEEDDIASNGTGEDDPENGVNGQRELDKKMPYPTHLLSCALDNTIKLWEVRSGRCIRTQFGHVEGVWDIAADNFRIISGSHDGSIKIWDLQSGKCMHTFHGRKLKGSDVNTSSNPDHDERTKSAPVACVCIGDSECFSGDEFGCVKMYKFDSQD